MSEDRTFDDVSRYGSARWCAASLGLPYDRFRRLRERLEQRSGFPPPDPINGLTIKADVDAWIAKRRRIADAVVVKEQLPQEDLSYDKF